jgi:hypothetical protein
MRKVVSYCKVCAFPSSPSTLLTETLLNTLAALFSPPRTQRHLAQEEKMKDTKSKEELEDTKSTKSLKNWGHDPLKNM